MKLPVLPPAYPASLDVGISLRHTQPNPVIQSSHTACLYQVGPGLWGPFVL
jgi:hypothetical protein